MHEYGYDCYFMLPLNLEAARNLWENANVPVYRLYEDGTEGMVESIEEFDSHAEVGGLFGIELEDWAIAQQRLAEIR
jgi:Leu/Phe-tRNA-protein transferase